MEDINNTSSATKVIERKLLQPHLIIQALAFTGILYFSVGQAPQNTTGMISQSVQTSGNLSTAMSNSVLQHASQQSGLPTSALRIVHAQQQTWSDNCLGLGESEVSCTQMPVPGWQVAVANGQQRWIYRTNASGSVIKLERGFSSPSKGRGKVAKRDRVSESTHSVTAGLRPCCTLLIRC